MSLPLKNWLLLGAFALMPCLGFAQDEALDEESEGGEEAVDVRELEALDQDTLDRVEALFFEGLSHYRAEHFIEAANTFASAYKLAAHRDLLFNIARSKERGGDTPGAIEYYRAYLATDPADMTAVIHRVQLLGGDPTPMPLEGERSVPVSAAVLAEPVETKSSDFPWHFVIGGAGLAALGLGTWFGVSAISSADDARSTDIRSVAISARDDAQSAAFGADVSLTLGVITVATALYLWWRSASD